MNLVEHLAVRTPLIWVTSDEPRRVIQDVIRSSDRDVFRLDVIDGFVGWVPEEEAWKKILVPQFNPETGGSENLPTSSMAHALQHTCGVRGVMIIEHAHGVVEQLIPFLDHISRTYVDAFHADDADAIPASLVMISYKNEVPPEIVRAVVRDEFTLPDEAELTSIVVKVNERIDVDATEVHREVRAGLGMSEFEFAQACALSISKHHHIDADFINKIKLNNLKKDGILEIRQPKISLDDVGGLDNAKDLITRVTWLWDHPETAKKYDLEPLRRILLVGVSGAGKSFLCEAVARSLGLDLAQFGVSRMMSKWIGESESNIRKALAQVKAMKPIVLWVDEFGRDMSGGQSSAHTDSGTTDRVHGEFLTGLQELPPEVFLVCAANQIDGLAPEMLRADRFDKIMFIGFPTSSERAEIWRIHLGEVHVNHDLQALAAATPLFTGAEIKHLIKETKFSVIGDHHRPPQTQDFLEAAPHLRGRVWVNHHEKILNMYKRALKEWDWASSGQEAEARSIIAGKLVENKKAEGRSLTDIFEEATGAK